MRGFWSKVSGVAAAIMLSAAVPLLMPAGLISAAHAQFSEGYTFLKGVRDRAKGDQAQKALDLLRKPGSTVVNYRDQGNGETALHIVVRQRDADWVNFLMAQGANPNIVNNSGETPLMIAVAIRSVDMASILLARGARIDQDNSRGETALIRAAQIGDVPMVRLLVSKGANPDKKDSFSGMSAREYATRDSRSTLLIEAMSKAKPAGSTRAVQGPVF